jgi:uncharacterized protein (TIGR02444 family)
VGWEFLSVTRDKSEIVDESVSLWNFSLAIYKSAAVQKACLGLQDRHGVDVNILLLCCWLASRGERIDSGEIDVVLARTTEWQSTVVVPLRGIRRHMKAGVRPVPIKDSEVLRARLKTLELEAERIEQQQLESAVFHGMELASDGSDHSVLAITNLTAYFSVLQIEPSKKDVQDLKTLSDEFNN